MKKKIALFDDDEAILEVIVDILNDEGYAVFAYKDSRNILQVLKDHSPDLLILDIWMPQINVKDTVNSVKKDNIGKNIPIILISALNEGEAISKELNVSGFIKKPFNVEELMQVVRQKIK